MARWLRPFAMVAALALAGGAAQAQDTRIAIVGPITGANAALGEQV